MSHRSQELRLLGDVPCGADPPGLRFDPFELFWVKRDV
jgi:hypothetical protein